MSQGRVLVVDDDAEQREHIHRLLTLADYDVVEAEDSQHAVEQMTTGDNPLFRDSIICVLGLPKESGSAAVTSFQSLFPDIPIIVVARYLEIQTISALFSLGVVDCLVTPVGPDKLLPAVERALEMPRNPH